MIDFKAEVSYKTLYEQERKENQMLKSENIKLHKNIDTLTRIIDKLQKKENKR